MACSDLNIFLCDASVAVSPEPEGCPEYLDISRTKKFGGQGASASFSYSKKVKYSTRSDGSSVENTIEKSLSTLKSVDGLGNPVEATSWYLFDRDVIINLDCNIFDNITNAYNEGTAGNANNLDPNTFYDLVAYGDCFAVQGFGGQINAGIVLGEGTPGTCSETCTANDSCKSRTRRSSMACYTLMQNGTIDQTRLSLSDITIRSNAPSSQNEIALDQLLKLKESNAFSQESCLICGNGEVDDCWSSSSALTILDSDNTIQKIKIKVATSKNDIFKTLNSIKGIIYYYFSNDDESPCCTNCDGPECFSGSIVTQKPFEINFGAKSFKNNQYLAVDIGELSNTSLQNYVGQNLKFCAKINN